MLEHHVNRSSAILPVATENVLILMSASVRINGVELTVELLPVKGLLSWRLPTIFINCNSL